MKRRILYALCAVLTLVVALVLVRQFKGRMAAWYADTHVVRSTAFPASEHADQICLTWSDDPRTTQTIQWRTAPSVSDGFVQYREDGQIAELQAESSILEDPQLTNDRLNARFTAVLRGLHPGVVYSYRVGSKQRGLWSDWAEFATAPDTPRPFSFIYIGDPQTGFDRWANLLHRCRERQSNAAFCVIAGDLVDHGGYRNDWDELFNAARGVFDHLSIVPTLGNHDYGRQEEPPIYGRVFDLPRNGPDGIPSVHAYSFRYGNALFIVLDSNLPLETQTQWLEAQLAADASSPARATWKFAVYHHPAYMSVPQRQNDRLRKTWGAVFDKYHLDMALQGHDHGYLRTYPMKQGGRVSSPQEGTYYVISVSGTRYHKFEARDYAEVGIPNLSTYQVLDIATNPDRLTYRAYDVDANAVDEVIINK